MILDYNFSKNQNKLNISYITKTGGKNIMSFNVSRFKTYFKTPEGRFENWDGSRCDEKYTSDPSKFDIHTYIEELDPKYKDLLNQQYFPKLYCFDIETEISDEFPDPGEAKQPITVISISSPELNTIVLGTRPLSELENKYCNDSFHEYLENTSYFHELKLKMPEFRYIHFDTEEAMLDYFLKNIVAKVAILSGWNCIRFDWQYITNRIKNYYPNIAIRNCSVIKTVNKKRFQDMSGLHYELPMPLHTLIIDMMDTVDQLDQAVLPIKESLSLNWIAEASLGIKKIEYDGSLQDLFENDYKKYVYYNTIDSVLVQLINYRFRCLDIIYQYSMYCNEKIGDCFSKIALTEALVFKDFYKHGIKIVYEKKENIERGNLVGAYVKVPKPGLYEFACCNDFASLYPSTIITVNISFENYIGQFIDKYSLVPYLGNKEYVVVGPIVYKNDGTAEAPKAGKVLHIFLDDAALDKYRKDPNYFVSVNGCVYKNDKDYAFKRIQSKLKADRNVSKYFVKEIDATIVSDIGETLKNRCEYREYSEGIVKELASLGYDIKNSNDLKAFSPEKLEHMKFELKMSMDFYESRQLAMKLLGNSMYGGSSHISFYWFNMNLANDITGEAKNLTLLMEKHLRTYWTESWETEPKLIALREKLGIKLKPDAQIKDIITKSPANSLCTIVYGDSVDGKSIIRLKDNLGRYLKMTIKDLYETCKELYGVTGIDDQGSEHVICPYEALNYVNGKAVYSKVKDIISHNVKKEKWRLKTKSGKVIEVTADHSLVVFRDGKQMTIKPRELRKNDKILILN